ncbi:MAG: hypothetical protein WDN03_10525 [Rhizomicrobium sp.]
MALAPEDMDFISNFSTFWAVFLGAVLATVGGFAATQLEWYLERKRRERNAALFFGEVLSTMHLIIGFAATTTKVGDPYGPVTLRMFRSAIGEVDIYNRNREKLYDLSHATLRAQIHTLILRVSMSIDGIFDFTNTIAGIAAQLEAPGMPPEERERLEVRVATLKQSRQVSYDFVLENAEQLRAVVKELEPIAHFSFDDVEKAVRRANS